jgi:hypothetical protein
MTKSEVVAAGLAFVDGVVRAKIAQPSVPLPRHHRFAYHEAAHAVSAALAGAKIAFATIDGAVPSVGFERAAGGDRWAAVTALAGPACEQLELRREHRLRDHEWDRHLNSVRSGATARCDFCKAVAAAGRGTRGGSREEMLSWLRVREDEAFRLLRLPPVWRAVGAVAIELRNLGTLPGPRVEQIVGERVSAAEVAAIREEIENVEDRRVVAPADRREVAADCCGIPGG